MIKIIADSTCDLGKELIERYNIDILPLYINLGDRECKDGEEITSEEIYQWSDANDATPKTAACSIEDAKAAIRPYMENEDDIIMFSISSEMSSSNNVMRMAAEDLEYDDHVYVIDSRNLSTGIGLLIVEAAEMIKKGMSAEEIYDSINALRPYVRASFVVDTLKYLHRGGRCSATSALVGGIFHIKPKIVVKNGKMDAAKKYRGSINTVIKRYVEDMLDDIKNAKKERIFITHSGCSQEVIDTVRNELESLGRFDEIFVTQAGGIISCHCGPGTLGVLFIDGGESFGPYDKKFDLDHNGVIDPNEKAEEAAYIRMLAEKDKEKFGQDEDFDEE